MASGSEMVEEAVAEGVAWREHSHGAILPCCVQAILSAVPDGWAKIDGDWVQVAQADRYDVEGPSGVIDGANVLITLPSE